MARPLKDPAVRQRRNKPASAASLLGPVAATRPLPERADGAAWRPEAIDVWREAWASPMAKQYVEADVAGLLVVAELTHQFWTRFNAKTAAELRQARAAYGLDPLARMRLGWKLEAPKAPAAVEPVQAPTRPRDPRLRAVS